MFTQRVEKVGAFEKVIISTEDQSFLIGLVPEAGAVLTDLVLDGTDIYDGMKIETDIENLDWGKGIFLAPFPNRLAFGKYTHLGKTYQFPLNDPGQPNALHGFVKDLSFQVEKIHLKASKARVLCSAQYEGQHAYYPFPFTTKVKYELSKREGLSVDFSVKNTGGTEIPIGLGWHPYFAFTDNVGDYFLQTPPLSRIPVNNHLIPTGEREEFNGFVPRAKIDETELDNCFHLDREEDISILYLESEKGKLTYTQFQKTGKTKCRYVQIFMPPGRKNIAIEPMTCNIDAFNNGEGLELLPPGSTIELKCKLKFESQNISA